MSYVTKDSGQRLQWSSGFRRDTQHGKPRYDLIYFPLLKRWAELMGRGAEKYGEENWKKAKSKQEYKRFKASLLRHVYQFLEENEDEEDHAAAILFNVAAIVRMRDKYGYN